MQKDNFNNVSVTPYGLADIRLLLRGAYIVAGDMMDSVPGDGLSKKIQGCLTKTGMREFIRLAKDPAHGFVVVHDEAESILHIPAGMIVSTAGLHEEDIDASGLRWGWFHPEATQPEVDNMVHVVQDSLVMYPELAESNYDEWQNLLLSSVLPHAVKPP